MTSLIIVLLFLRVHETFVHCSVPAVCNVMKRLLTESLCRLCTLFIVRLLFWLWKSKKNILFFWQPLILGVNTAFLWPIGQTQRLQRSREHCVNLPALHGQSYRAAVWVITKPFFCPQIASSRMWSRGHESTSVHQLNISIA